MKTHFDIILKTINGTYKPKKYKKYIQYNII